MPDWGANSSAPQACTPSCRAILREGPQPTLALAPSTRHPGAQPQQAGRAQEPSLSLLRVPTNTAWQSEQQGLRGGALTCCEQDLRPDERGGAEVAPVGVEQCPNVRELTLPSVCMAHMGKNIARQGRMCVQCVCRRGTAKLSQTADNMRFGPQACCSSCADQEAHIDYTECGASPQFC